MWLVMRTLLWTLVSTLTQPNAPLDTVEWLSWGRQWELGYHKHPPLAAWIGEIAYQLGGRSLVGVYLVSHAAVSVCLWCAWAVGTHVLPSRLALAGALSLEAVVYYAGRGGEFGNNVILMACWALAVLAFHRALVTDRLRVWLATGLAIGLAMLTKYTAAFLVAAMIGFMPAGGRPGRCWRRPGPYVAAAVAGMVLLPHLLWGVRHGFPTIDYAFYRTAADPGAGTRLRLTGSFIGAQALRLFPMLFLLAPLLAWHRREARPAGDGEGRFHRGFLSCMLLVPLMLHVLAALIAGRRVLELYGMPLWTFAGVWLLSWGAAPLTARRWWYARAMWWAVVTLSLVGVAAVHVLGPSVRGRTSRIHFPGRTLARSVEEEWHKEFNRPLPLAAGDWWLAGNVSLYGADRPAVYAGREPDDWNPDPAATPWTDDADLQARGGVLLWNAAVAGDALPFSLRARFPEAMPPRVLILPYAYAPGLPPARIGVALALPAGNRVDAGSRGRR